MKTLIELEIGECRYPFGADGGFVFCAKPQHFYEKAGAMCQSSYCHEHYMICVEPLKQRTVV